MQITPAEPNAAQPPSAPLLPRHGKLAFFLVTGLFFLWAIPGNLYDEFIRRFIKPFEIDSPQAVLA